VVETSSYDIDETEQVVRPRAQWDTASVQPATDDSLPTVSVFLDPIPDDEGEWTMLSGVLADMANHGAGIRGVQLSGNLLGITIEPNADVDAVKSKIDRTLDTYAGDSAQRGGENAKRAEAGAEERARRDREASDLQGRFRT
jgi:hypothetical protein